MSSDELVKINTKKESQKDGSSDKGGLSRRRFLQVVGGASVAGMAGCADSPKQNLLPYVKGDSGQIPGEALWYSSSCTECSAGCGIQVRTREGRVVKVEGNAVHPINKGGLCALGQSSLQNLYDPDRVRQPLEASVDASGKRTFKPISWDKAYKKVAGKLKSAKGKVAVLRGEQNGSLQALYSEWASAFGAEQVVYDATQPVALAEASKLVYGHYGVPHYRFDKAEVILNFGADFLETWISPAEYARGWAMGRKPGHLSRVIHVEPRLSLTAARADKWLQSKPGKETGVAYAVLKLLLERGAGSSLSEGVRSELTKLTRGVSVSKVAEESGVSRADILLIADYLIEAKSSLAIAGGAVGSASTALALQVACGFINLVLSNVGRTVMLGSMTKPETSLSAMRALLEKMEGARVKKNEGGQEVQKFEPGLEVLLIHGTNPAHSLPSDLGFAYKRKRVPFVVSLSSHLDDTASLADLILPSHTSLEDWGDVVPRAGVNGLMQPAMTPVFDTRSAGDTLLRLAKDAGQSGVGSGAESYKDYLQARWKDLHRSAGVGGSFKNFWLKSLERGGYFDQRPLSERVRVNVSAEAYRVVGDQFKLDGKGAGAKALVLYPYFSVKTFDGRAANRAWLQELPDPMTKVVWDSWAEIHPGTAKKHGIKNGDPVAIRNHYGQVTVPAVVTEHIAKGVVAVPVGQGHSSYGRYASAVSGGNVYDLLPAAGATKGAADSISLLAAKVSVKRGRGKPNGVVTQIGNTQMGRELARTRVVGGHGHGDDHHGGHGGHAEAKQMYEQRRHPLYEWGLAVDLAACTGCSACVVACYAENNVAVVGKEVCHQGREMSWIRLDRYYETDDHGDVRVHFQPMMCQHCNNAPCEPVCPIYATYHNDEGLNVMVYNRCVGTRYCGNNCTYKVRRFNWFEFEWPEPLNMQLNPDVGIRVAGVMEKCTFCVQRINAAKDIAKDEGRLVMDGEVQPACVQSCPTQALTFGNLKDPKSAVSKLSHDDRAYKVLDHHINTQPSVSYLEDLKKA